MKNFIIVTMLTLTLGLASCQKLIEHRCTCRDFEGNFVESTEYTGSETVAQDECAQRENALNENAPPVELYTCTLD